MQENRRWSFFPLVTLWVLAVLLYGLGDIVTTQMVFSTGGHELNPVLGAAIHTFGRNLWSLVLIKVVVFGVLIGLSLAGFLRPRWAVPGLLSVVGAGLVVNNSIACSSL